MAIQVKRQSASQTVPCPEWRRSLVANSPAEFDSADNAGSCLWPEQGRVVVEILVKRNSTGQVAPLLACQVRV